jgi:predicted  nucleic acid-binding Zn-ribbon protein
MIDALKSALEAANKTYNERQDAWAKAQGEVVETEASLDKVNARIAELTQSLQEAQNGKSVLDNLLKAANTRVDASVVSCKEAQLVQQELAQMIERVQPKAVVDPTPVTIEPA